MPKEGEDLERIIEKCHRLMEPADMAVTWNDHLLGRYSKKHRQIDVSIKLKSDPSMIKKIIECKDHTRALELKYLIELEGNRDEVGADGAIAVATSGYSDGDRNYAEGKGLDLRELGEVDPSEFSWLGCREIISHQRWSDFFRADMITVKGNAPIDRIQIPCNTPIIKFNNNPVCVSIHEIWKSLPSEQMDIIYEDIKPGEPKVRMKIIIKFEEGNYPQNFIGSRVFPIKQLILYGDVCINIGRHPILSTRAYRGYSEDGGGIVYTEIAEFDYNVDGQPQVFRMFRHQTPGTDRCRMSFITFEKPTPPKTKKKKPGKKRFRK